MNTMQCPEGYHCEMYPATYDVLVIVALLVAILALIGLLIWLARQ